MQKLQWVTRLRFTVNEMISEGNVGLMQAVKKFEPGFRLATYAMWWIKHQSRIYFKIMESSKNWNNYSSKIILI